MDRLPWVWSVAHHLGGRLIPLMYSCIPTYFVFVVKQSHLGYQLIKRHILKDKTLTQYEEAADDDKDEAAADDDNDGGDGGDGDGDGGDDII